MKKSLLSYLTLLAGLWSGTALAQTVRTSGQINYPKTFNGLTIFQGNRAPLLPDYIQYIFTLIIMAAGLIILWVIISSGFEWYISAGNAGKVKESKDRIFAAFVGVIILFLAYLILQTINPALTTMNLTTYSTGISIENSMQDKIMAPYYVADLTTLDPPGNTIRIPQERITSTKIYFFTGRNFSGEPTEAAYNWSCPAPKAGDEDQKAIECTMPLPEAYNKGSLITYELKPGVYIYKRVGQSKINQPSKAVIPFYISGDIANIEYMNDYSNIPGKIVGFRIYNGTDPKRRIGIVAWEGKNYEGKGVVFAPPYHQGWSPQGTEDNPSGIATFPWADSEGKQLDIKSIKVLEVGNRQPADVEVYSEGEYFPDSLCELIDKSSENETAMKQQYLEINCSPTSNNFPKSIRVRNGIAVMISQFYNGQDISLVYGGNPHIADKYYLGFIKGEVFKGNDPNLNDNREIGECVCSNRNWWTLGIACAIWQSCGTHLMTFPIL